VRHHLNPRGPSKTNEARDAEIRRRRLAGEAPSVLALEFGLHASRITQIARRIPHPNAATSAAAATP
jgi:hypothetical protein